MQGLCVLMSIKPKYVDMILSGQKDIELRRKSPSFQSGTRIVMYSSAPEKAVMGWTTVEAIHVRPKEELWEYYGHRTGINRKEFSLYFRGLGQACGIELSQPRYLLTPISLEFLREYCQGFRPPQSYQFIKREGPLAEALTIALGK
jgi:predicted transcriptional regulator